MAKFKLEDGTEIEAFTADEVEAKVNDSVFGLKAKNDELLGESKTAKQRAKELEDEKSKFEKEQLEKQGEYKSLLEKEREERRKETEKSEAFRLQVEKKDIEISLSSLANEATKDQSRAKVLKKLLSENAKYGEDGVYFELDGAVVEPSALLEKSRTEYSYLFDGSQATGGGATGGNGGGAAKKFNELTGMERNALYKTDRAEYDRLKSQS